MGSIFTYTDYKRFLDAQLKYGEHRKFAEHLGCQPAFLSQVLRGPPNLSLEQGILVANYFRLSKDEQRFFMSLLQLSRAGSDELRKFYLTEIKQMVDANSRVSKRIPDAGVIGHQLKDRYYSTWKYSWVHVLAAIPHANVLENICKISGLPKEDVHEILLFLERGKLIKKKNNGYEVLNKKIHIDADEPQAPLHHRNFRLKTLEQLEKKSDDALHFSSILALSINDGEKIKELLLRLIEETEAVLRPSKEETSKVLCIDYFSP